MKIVSLVFFSIALSISGLLPADEKVLRPETESWFFTPPGAVQEGLVRTLEGPESATLRIVVLDEATGKPVPCRINVIGEDGHFYQPEQNPLSLYSLTGQWPEAGAKGNRKEKGPWRYLGRFFYSTGTISVAVPPGTIRIEVSRGFEHRPQSATVNAVRGQVHEVQVTLQRTSAMDHEGYFGGDPHLHLARATEQDEETLLELLTAEDIAFGTPLGYNEPAGPYAGFMDRMDYPQYRGLGRSSIRTKGAVSILSGQEYRSGQYGHLNLYLRDRLVLEGQSLNADDWPVYGLIGAETQSQGGYAIHAHGGYAQEIYADAALGTVNAVELLQFGVYRGIGLIDWYHMLNTGYRFPCVGASDYPACRFLGDCRTYVWHRPENASAAPPENSRPEFPAWLKNAAAGQSFVTTGPLLLLEVDGRRPGETIRKEPTDSVTVQATIRMRCEVTPVQRIDLIVNGQVTESFPVAPEQSAAADNWLTIERSLVLNTSSWIAARAWSVTPGGQPDAESHTNPVYVYLGDRKPYQQESLDEWVRRIDVQMAKHASRSFPQKARVLDYFQQARDRLLRIRDQGGLKISDDPSRIDATETESGFPPLELDTSRPDMTEAELKEFLKPVPARAPADAVRTFEGVDGFRMELVAAEPLVHSPIAAAFDEDGNLFVCEMTDYPYKPTKGADPIGTVRLLRDIDGDGDFDEAHVFADRLLWAAGVVPWRGGVFVAATPDILYLKDTDGDFRADVRRTVFTGFGQENQQAMVNNLQLGMDHWVYGSTAGNGGLIRPGSQPNAPGIPVDGRDFRFNPVTEEFELVTGTVQFGNTFDDWGNRFTCSQSQPLVQIVLPDHYLARNPFLPSPSGIKDLAPGPVPIFRISPVERWRQIRSSRRIAGNERMAVSAGASHHVIDAAAGVVIYRGGAYPPEYYGQAFVGDGQNNLIHRRRLVPDGVAMGSERVDSDTDFIRSSDIWFRPVNLINAPDGTLYCCDMSREVLESIHIPLDVVKHLDLRSGRKNGRIYRIAPPEFRSPAPPRLSQASTADLISALESPHGWYRDTAHRLLYERQDISAVPELKRLVRESTRPQTRLLAAWQLRGLAALDDDTCLQLLSDPHAGVRENAVRLAEAWLDQSSTLLNRVCALADDEEVRVRFQTAFSLGTVPGPQTIAALRKLAVRDGDDLWMRTAVLSSVAASADKLLTELISMPELPASATAVIRELAAIVGARNQTDEVAGVLDAFATSPVGANANLRESLLLELGRAMRRSGGRFPAADISRPGGRLLLDAIQSATRSAQDPAAAETARVSAIQLLSCQNTPEPGAVLVELLAATQPVAVQVAAVAALADDSDPRTAEILLQHWRTFVPETRAAAMTGLLLHAGSTTLLLEAAVREEISVADIEPTRRELLLKHSSPGIRGLAEQLFGRASEQPRQAIVAEYRKALSMAGDAEAGKRVFEKTCAACHQLGGIGNSIGPNLASSPSRDPSALLNNILDPNQFVLPSWLQYTVVDKSGRSYSGLLASQSATSVTLKKEKAEIVTILRGDIEELVSSGKSLMPEGLEKELSLQSTADLIAWIAGASAQTPDNPHAERDFGTLPGLIE